MSNSGDASNQGSSSLNTNPPPTEVSPRRRSGGDNSPLPTPRGRGSSPRRPPTTPVPGPSTSRPDARPPVPHWLSPGSSRGASGSSGLGFEGAHAVPVGGSGGGVAAAGAGAGALGIGGSLTGRKRPRDADVAGAAAAGGGGGDGGGNQPAEDHPCRVCGKSYSSLKALFGHMRKHPDRGWKGVHPPPAFRAEEEFADIRAEVAGAGGAAADAEAEAEDDGGEPRNYRVPDLNHPPPPDT